MKKLYLALSIIPLVALALHSSASAEPAAADVAVVQKLLATAQASPVPKDAKAHHQELAHAAGKIADESLRQKVVVLLPELEGAAEKRARIQAIETDLKSKGGVATLAPGGPDWLCAVAGESAMHVFDRLTGVSINDKQSPHNKDYHLLTEIGDEWLAPLQDMTDLENINIGNTAVKGPGLKYLAGLTKLQSLNLTLCPTTDEYLQPLSNLTEMKVLGLASAKCNGTCFKYLGKWTKLENLNFHYTPVNDDGLREICRMTSLERLEIVHCHWTDSGAANLVNLKNIQRLQLGSREATGASIAFLRGLPKLHELDLHDLNNPSLAVQYASEIPTLKVLRCYLGGLKDADYQNIAKLANLEELILGGGTITDAGAASLGELKKLKKLTLGGMKVPPPILEKLKAANPGLVVMP